MSNPQRWRTVLSQDFLDCAIVATGVIARRAAIHEDLYLVFTTFTLCFHQNLVSCQERKSPVSYTTPDEDNGLLFAARGLSKRLAMGRGRCVL